MKKIALLFFICLLLLSLASCGENDTPDVPSHDPTPQAITVAELDNLTSGEQALLTAVVEGTMGDKLYVSDSTGACELTDISLFLLLRCEVGHLFEFTVKVTDSVVTATNANLVSRNNAPQCIATITKSTLSLIPSISALALSSEYSLFK